MDNNEKLLQHKLKCKLCQNLIQDYDVKLYTNQPELMIYAEIKNKYEITFETLKEHKLFIPQLYTQKQLLELIRDHDFSKSTNSLVKENKLISDTKYMQKICNNILWEEIPLIINDIIIKAKNKNISTNVLISILDKLVACSKKIEMDDIGEINMNEAVNDEAGKRKDMGGLAQKSFENMIDELKKANEALKNDD